MNKTIPASGTTDETPVDDVRRVRRKLSEETGNDINRLADRANALANKLSAKLGLKRTSAKHEATS